MPMPLTKQIITLDGNLFDWNPSERIDYDDVPGYSLYSDEQAGSFYFALSGNVSIDVGTTFWLNTDQDAATGYQVFGYAAGAEYNVTVSADGTASLYTGGAGATKVADLQIAYSADHSTIEFAVPAVDIGSPAAIDTLYQVNNSTYGPTYYTLQPYVALADSGVTPTIAATRIGIVYSETTAELYFSRTGYNDLIMSAENQAFQAGIPFDILTESDLTNLAKVANYSALVFPSFSDVQASQATAITNTLLQAAREFGVGLVTSGDFMTNDQTGAVLGADPYGRMKALFGVTRQTGGNSDDVTITSTDTSQTVLKDTAPGATIRIYTDTGWSVYQNVNGTGQTIATQTIDGSNTYPAMMTTQTAGKNVVFSSNSVMADSNLLGQAIGYLAKPAGVSVSLDMTRFAGIVATRMDMDQSQFPSDVEPNGDVTAGIYAKLIPILQQWNQQYDFTGSYYLNIGDNPTAADPSTTNWTAILPYYLNLLAMGGEIGTHSYTHLINPPTVTFTAHTVGTTAMGSTQIQLDSIPGFAGVTVGMLVSGFDLGTNTPLPGAAGEGGSVANTYVTAVDPATNTITINYTPGGYGTPNIGTIGAIPASTTLAFSIPTENTNFLQTTGTGTVSDGTVLSHTGNFFTYAYEFGQAKTDLQTQLGVPIYGAAVPGATETAKTSLNIMQYFPSGADYTGYVTGGWTGVGSGYPNAFGYIDPSNTGTIYLAPNLNFDFTGIQYQGLSIAEVGANWQTQIADIAANSAGPPIYIWPIHDYGAAAWDTSDSGGISPYTTQMYTDFISSAFARGDEFVTLEDLASRIQSFTNSGVTTSVSGNVITANVVSFHAGEFALDVIGQVSGQVIENVGNWYAFDSNSVLLPDAGGTYTITLGTVADAVTHIVSLPMRGELLNVTGDGVNIAFSMIGEGDVLIDLASPTHTVASITGGIVSSQTGNQVVVKLIGLGQHDVSLTVGAPPPTETVSTLSFSADNGASATDFITNVAAQTITGTLTAALAAGNSVTISLDNGVTWQAAAATAGATSFLLTGVTLTGSGTLIARVLNSTNIASPPLTQAYVLDQTPPAQAIVIVSMTHDSRVAGDFVTNDGAAGRSVAGTLSAALGAGETFLVSFDGATTWIPVVVSGTAWNLTDPSAHSANWTIEAQIVDLAGNVSPLAITPVTFDNTLPAAPTVPDLAATSDNGASSTDNITNIKTPTFVGTAEAGGTVTLYDGTKTIGTAVAATDGSWSIISSRDLANGAHSITAKATDLAGNVGLASAAATVIIDTIKPVRPAAPTLTSAADSGILSTDGITNVASQTLIGTVEANALVTLLDGTTPLGTTAALSTGAWSLTTPTLGDGIHRITVTATDVAGNVSAASPVRTITIDTISPNAPALTGGNANKITGTGEATDVVTFYDGSTPIGSTTVNASSAWNWTFLPPASVRTITALQTDKAGNTGPASTTKAIIGGTGADTLISTSANELLIGGASTDTYVFSSGFGLDIIVAFTAAGAAHDIINFHAVPALSSFASVQSHATQVGSAVVIAQDSTNILTLINMTKTALTSSDFTFI